MDAYGPHGGGFVVGIVISAAWQRLHPLCRLWAAVAAVVNIACSSDVHCLKLCSVVHAMTIQTDDACHEHSLVLLHRVVVTSSCTAIVFTQPCHCVVTTISAAVVAVAVATAAADSRSFSTCDCH